MLRTAIVNATCKGGLCQRLLLAGLLPGFCLGTVFGQTTSLASSPPTPRPSQTAQQRSPQSSSSQAARAAQAAVLMRSLERLFVPPQQASQPKTTQSSATRSGGKCAPDEAEINAIAPPGGYGLTLSDRPAITLQLPPSSTPQSIALVFHNPADGSYETAQFPLSLALRQSLPQVRSSPSEPQWVSVQLPADRPGLQPHQPYRWSLVAVCGEAIEPDDPTFSGWIEYHPVAPSLAPSLVALSPQQRLRWYAQRGYWYDLLPLTRPALAAAEDPTVP